MDEQAGTRGTRGDLRQDPVEGEDAAVELAAEDHLQHEERRGQLPWDDDLLRAQLVERQLLLRDHDRPVAGAHARAVREQEIAVLDERIRRERDRGHLEAALERPLVERLDVLAHRLEVEAARVDGARREAPEHEGVVGVRAEAETNEHRAAGP